MDIHVSNLSAATTSEELRKAFSAHGQVSKVTILTEQRSGGKETGTSLGYGFVAMPVNGEARAALAALGGKDLHGSPLKVQQARPFRVIRHRG
jgi:RNA recognition motif-containing protein